MSSHRRPRKHWSRLGYEPEAARNMAAIATDHPDWDDAGVIAQHEYEIRALELSGRPEQVQRRG